MVPVAVGLGVLAVGGLGVFWFLLESWSDLQTATSEAAGRAFADSLARAGGGIPYLEIAAAGDVQVHRELEREAPVSLRTLHLLVWQPDSGRLLRIAFPFWFVRAKMTRSLNLGTLASALARDWKHLDLRVTEDDLERRGPGLVLDQTRADGARILLWTE
ncbi:MAG: hypothetical protein ACE5HD_01140 [Acidobacteriota bacterium]